MSSIQTHGDGSPIFHNEGDATLNVIFPQKVINPYNLKKVLAAIEEQLKDEPDLGVAIDEELSRIDILRKNRINRLEDEGIDTYHGTIQESSIYFAEIKEIISAPGNSKIKRSYNNILKTLKGKIALLVNEKDYFSQVMDELIHRLLMNDDDELLENEDLVTIVIHFMYYICHIGEKE